MTWKCPNCWTKYEIDERYAEALKDKQDCKFCVRKDPNIPTTAEMDGLLTVEDMRMRNQVVMQCKGCRAWTQMTHNEQTELTPCTGIVKGARIPKYDGCGQINYDSSSMKSLRTFNITTDIKRRVK